MAHGQVIALQARPVVEHHIEPVYVGLSKQVVILSRVKANLLLEADSLGCVHHVPLAVRKIGETLLCTQRDIDLFGRSTALGCNNHHTIGSTCTID